MATHSCGLCALSTHACVRAHVTMARIIMAYLVTANKVAAYIVTTKYSYGLYTHGPHSYCLCSDGLIGRNTLANNPTLLLIGRNDRLLPSSLEGTRLRELLTGVSPVGASKKGGPIKSI